MDLIEQVFYASYEVAFVQLRRVDITVEREYAVRLRVHRREAHERAAHEIACEIPESA